MNQLKGKSSYQALIRDVETFVKSKTEGYSPLRIGHKTIHDPIWGSTEYSEWEMQLIDSPLIQRLRGISQVGLAVLTYPAARHSRFEHTLGVAAAAKRLADRININNSRSGEQFQISPDTKNKLVLAAILHDVGHCFFSHLSESIYGDLEEFKRFKSDIKALYDVKPKAHEMFSLLITNSKAFKAFFKKIDYPDKGTDEQIESLLEDVGKIIIGVNLSENGVIASYQTAIINGSFDVDKLDYIKRDSYTAGLALDFDIERLFTKTRVYKVTTGSETELRLVIEVNGVTAIEELTFCKIMLYSYIYYHQKVLITEEMIKDYVQALLKLELISSYADFLALEEANLFELSSRQKTRQPYPEYGGFSLKKLAESIKNRVLPKRCLEISQNIMHKLSAEEPDDSGGYQALYERIKSCSDYTVEMLTNDVNRLFANSTRSNDRYIAGFISRFETHSYDKILDIRRELYDTLVDIYELHGETIEFSMFDIYFMLPHPVSYGTPGEKNILGRDGTLMSINDFVKLDQWASSFNAYKWRGYVFVTEGIRRDFAMEACRKVIFNDEIELDSLMSYLKHT